MDIWVVRSLNAKCKTNEWMKYDRTEINILSNFRDSYVPDLWQGWWYIIRTLLSGTLRRSAMQFLSAKYTCTKWFFQILKIYADGCHNTLYYTFKTYKRAPHNRDVLFLSSIKTQIIWQWIPQAFFESG